MSSSAINTQVAQQKIGNVQNQADNSAVYSGGIWSLKNSTALTSVTITDAGNVGIGTTSPAQKLHIASGGVIRLNRADNNAVAYGDFNYGGSGIGFQWNDTNGDGYTFKNSGTTVMRINASGNVGIGTTNPTQKLDVYAGSLSVGSHYDGTLNTDYKIRLRSVGAATNNNYLGEIGLAGGGAQPSDSSLTFSTQTWNGSAYVTSEKMRIDTSGNLLVGTTSSPNYHTLVKTHNDWCASIQNSHASSPFGLLVRYTGTSPNNGSNHFFLCLDTTTTRMNVYANGGIANYQGNNINLSDRREKKDFAPAKSYLDTICQIPVQTFKYVDQTDEEKTLGVIAQDVQAVAPELVSEDDWGTEEAPKTRLSIYQTDLQYALMKCIQELKEKNDALEARLAALEAKP